MEGCALLKRRLSRAESCMKRVDELAYVSETRTVHEEDLLVDSGGRVVDSAP